MAEEIAVENGKISNFQGLVTLTLDRVILHTIMHHSSTSTYRPNFIEIEETFCGRTDVHLRSSLLGRLRRVDLRVDLIKQTAMKTPPTSAWVARQWTLCKCFLWSLSCHRLTQSEYNNYHESVFMQSRGRRLLLKETLKYRYKTTSIYRRSRDIL